MSQHSFLMEKHAFFGILNKFSLPLGYEAQLPWQSTLTTGLKPPVRSCIKKQDLCQLKDEYLDKRFQHWPLLRLGSIILTFECFRITFIESHALNISGIPFLCYLPWIVFSIFLNISFDYESNRMSVKSNENHISLTMRYSVNV